jgi:hypothetical protein
LSRRQNISDTVMAAVRITTPAQLKSQLLRASKCGGGGGGGGGGGVLCARDRSKKKKLRVPLVKLRRRRLECFFGSNRFYLTPTKRGKGVPLPSTEHNRRPVLNVPYFLTSSADFKFLAEEFPL